MSTTGRTRLRGVTRRPRCRRAWGRCLAHLPLVVLLMALSACGSGPARTTDFTQDDLDVTVNEMAASLAASDFLNERTADSPRIVLVTNQVRNLTDNIMTTTERWMLIARLQSTMPIRTMADQKNIVFVLPPERLADLRRNGFDRELPVGLEPTHVMTATFYSSQRAAREGGDKITSVKSNFYYLEYSITAVDSREILWSDAFEFGREARGNIID